MTLIFRQFNMEPGLCYEWTAVLRKKWERSDQFYLENVEDIAFMIHARFNGMGNLEVKVEKGYTKPAKAEVKIGVKNKDAKIHTINDWRGISSCIELSLNRSSFVPRACYGNNGYQENEYPIHITYEILQFELVEDPPYFMQFENFKDFTMRSELSDVIIKVKEKEFPAHKIILAAQSPFLLNMFVSNKEETPENGILIEDMVEIDIMEEVLKFLYTGETSARTDTTVALKALAAAEKYKIIKLKQLCELTLGKNLSTKNALSIFDAADKHDADELRQKTIAFMAKNKSEIVSNPDFKKMCREKPELMFEFMVLAIA